MSSQPFYCAGRGFVLLARCKAVEQVPHFSLTIKMVEENEGAVRGTIDYTIGVKTRPSLKFLAKDA